MDKNREVRKKREAKSEGEVGKGCSEFDISEYLCLDMGYKSEEWGSDKSYSPLLS